ncbi:hypothetical protein SAMN04488494_3046 [Xylanibacter ruminicola]|uniref:Lipoprotein n=1 Tax=Xylanibacter ruminicola TaxID=839 RepID=A0A1M7MZI0_XYLRU|nr:hypothetical protein [Xylanibacter ruminicola]SFC36150.1 hypothetical protein SAMN04488493_10612 [Xylanibacter ruminicola]SHM96081.1 hypothetical protein SAMN04488494_3046 [Xylanibacter ruminicola]
MKNLIKYTMGALAAGVMMTACSPEKFDGADPNGIPSVSGVDFSINVDQETNQMIANYTPQPGTYPIWIINGNTYSTLQEVGFQNPEAGTYTIDMKLGNRNGFSQGVISKTFTFNETKIDYSADFRRICDKEWRIANKEQGHLGCGPAGTAATEWWSAAPNDKKDFGVYDDRITFTATTRKGGSYTYNAGADGNTYVNKGVTKWNTQNDNADVDVAVGNQTSSWSFEIYDWEDAEGNVTKQTYIQLANNTAFPYISSDAQYENPKFRIETLTATKLVLVYDAPDRGIAWRYILTSAPDERLVEEQGFDANSDFNLWKGITPNATFYFNPGWGTERTGEMEAGYTGGNNDYTVTVPDACSDRWQAQFHLHTDLNLKAGTNYDFSVIFNADKDIDGVTVKLTDEADADAIIDVADVNLKAGQDIVFWQSDIAGKDLSKVKLVFDFGHATGATKINVSNVVIKDHANDDGTIVSGGGEEGEKPVMDWNYESGANLWKAVDDGTVASEFAYWFADDSWTQITSPVCTHSGDTYELTMPDGIGGSQWQGQFHIDTKLTASASKAYNFYCVLEADNDCAGVTFKLTDGGDSNFLLEERIPVKADEPLIVKREGLTLKDGADADQLRMFFDFGGTPAGTHVKISKIYLEEAVVLNYDDASNLWKGVDDGSVKSTFAYWFANDAWTELANQPVATRNGDTVELTLPEGMGGSQWQGQFHIDTELTAKANKEYHFQVVVTADADCPGVTIKLTDSGDSNFFCEGRHDIKADEPYTFTLKNATLKEGTDASALRLFFDFGGSTPGTKVKISKIVFKEA